MNRDRDINGDGVGRLCAATWRAAPSVLSGDMRMNTGAIAAVDVGRGIYYIPHISYLTLRRSRRSSPGRRFSCHPAAFGCGYPSSPAVSCLGSGVTSSIGVSLVI